MKSILVAAVFNVLMVSGLVAGLKDWKPATALPERPAAIVLPAQTHLQPTPTAKLESPKTAPIVTPKVGPPTNGNGYDANGVWQSNAAFFGASH